MSIEMVPVASSAVAAVGYDAAARTLAVQFTNGKRYEYRGVPEEKYVALLKSSSIGQFVNHHIKPHYAHK